MRTGNNVEKHKLTPNLYRESKMENSKINITIRDQDGVDKNIRSESPASPASVLSVSGQDRPYPVIAAKVDGRVRQMDHPITDDCTLEFLDLRNATANRIYQNSVVLLYLKAVKDVLGDDSSVRIQNSLSKGLFTKISAPEKPDSSVIDEIKARMDRLVQADLPIKAHMADRDRALELIDKMGFEDKERLLEAGHQYTIFKYYDLDGYRDFFYSLMVPSTGYIYLYDLMPYGDGVLLRLPQPSAPDVIPPFVEETNMYAAFKETESWQDLLDINDVTDLNGAMKRSPLEIITLCEALHEKRIVEIANEIREKARRMVLIAGPSSSGKTTFAKRLCTQLKVLGLSPLYLGTDDYFIDRDDLAPDENGEKNFEDLEALDLQLFNSDMTSLLEGGRADIPRFDFVSGKKIFGERIVELNENSVVIIEGIHALNGKLSQRVSEKDKYRIYISPLTQLGLDSHNRIPTTDTRVLRRIARDSRTRGYSASATLAIWPKVRAGEDKNIFPYSNEADTVFNSMLIYELSILKKHVLPLLESVGKDSPEFSEALRMIKFLEFFQDCPHDDYVSNQSILREFIGGSIYV